MGAYRINRTGDDVSDLLDQVAGKSIYPNATRSTAGLMSAEDKSKVEEVPDTALTNLEIEAILNT